MSYKIALLLNQKDNVVTLCDTADRNDSVKVISRDGEKIDEMKTSANISFPYHKIALEGLRKGSEIVKYGEVIGKATQNIKRGEWVHTHNTKSLRMKNG